MPKDPLQAGQANSHGNRACPEVPAGADTAKGGPSDGRHGENGSPSPSPHPQDGDGDTAATTVFIPTGAIQDMDFAITKNPVGLIEFTLDGGESVTAEAAAMVYMRGDIRTETGMRKGGFLRSLKAAAFGGESFFVNTFVAQEDGCRLALTGNMLGDIEDIDTGGEEFIVQSGAFVCSTSGLTLDTKWQGFTKGIFGTNMFMLKTEGPGRMFVNAFGGIVRADLRQGERMVLDNHQLVALSAGARYRVTKHGSLKTTLLGGEALVIEITGPGRVYLQTKSMMEFARALVPFLPKNR